MPAMRRFAAVALTLSTGCATIMTGTTDSVMVQSEPPGAAFTTNTGHAGTTPRLIEIPDNVDLEVRYTLDGYEEGYAVAKKKHSAWVLGNVLLGGLIGFGLDIISGHVNVHANEVTCMLVPLKAPETVAVADEVAAP